MSSRIRKGQQGFTLVEMAVVIAILGILAAVATPLLVNYLGGAKERAYEADLGIVQTAVDAFFGSPNNFRFLGKNQYPIIGRGETDPATTTHTVRIASFAHPDDGTPLTATQRDATAGIDNPDWNPLGGTQGADLLKAGTASTTIAWTDDGDGVREILEAASATTRSPDTWTTIQVTREAVTYYVDPRYYFVDMDALVSARLLKEIPKSSSLDNSTTGAGAFTYYVDDKGKVQTLPFDFPRTNGFKVAATSTPAGTFLLKWGSAGSGDGQFISFPKLGVAVDASGNVYVLDQGDNRVQKFTSSGTFITKWGSLGADDGQFSSPIGLAVDASGNVYVTDPLNNRVQKFSSSGAFVLKWGSQGTADGQFSFPAGVAVDASGNVYVADNNNNRVQKFSSSGAFVLKWGSQGTADGQFNSPLGVAVDASGNVYVANANALVQKFTSAGVFLAKWGTQGSGDGQFSFPLGPFGVAVDASGNVYVADPGNNRVQKFTSAGQFLAKWGSFGAGDGQFNEPDGVAVDASGNVYVLDQGNHRVQKFTSGN